MNILESDSEDSGFFFTDCKYKRKAGNDVTSKAKKSKLNYHDSCNAEDTTFVQKKEERAGILKNLVEDPKSGLTVNSCKDTFEIDTPCNRIPSVLNINEKNESKNFQAGEMVVSKLRNFSSCPLCLKNFDSENAHIFHMKQCAKKSKMTPKQLLEALEQHKKQLQERIAMGLSHPTKKKKKPRFQEGSESTYQLALALALSSSLADDCQSHENKNESTNAIISTGTSSTTLEKFGFTSSGSNCVGPGKKKPKNSKLIASALRERSREDREKLVTEKAAVILLDEDETDISKTEDLLVLHRLKYKEQSESSAPLLWGLGENEDNTKWYVDEIKNVIQDIKGVEEDVENESLTNEEDDIVDEIDELNLPRMSILEDWRKLINNKHLSDIAFYTLDRKEMFLHTVVLYARSPKILDLDLKEILSNYNSITVLSFLKYLYCGILDGLLRSEVENLFHLAELLNYQELLQVLSNLKEKLTEKYGDEKRERNLLATSPNNLDCKSTNIKQASQMFDVEEQPRTSSPVGRDSSCNNFIHLKTICSNSSADIHRQINQRSSPSPKNDRDIINLSWANYPAESNDDSSRPEELAVYDVRKGGSKAFQGAESESEIITESEDVVNYSKLVEKHEGNSAGPSSLNIQIEDSERDLFDDIESSSVNFKGSFKRESSRLSNASVNKEEDDGNCDISVLYDSTQGRAIEEDSGEKLTEKNELEEMPEFEIPFFDPYEHFNSEIPLPDSPVVVEEEPIESQSMLIGEVSPLKSVAEGRPTSVVNERTDNPKTEEPVLSPSKPTGFCSTPKSGQCLPSVLFQVDANVKKSEKSHKKRKNVTPCTRVRRSSVKRSLKWKLTKSRSVKRNRSLKIGSVLNAEESEKVATILTASILSELSNSNMSPSNPAPPGSGQTVIEVTPPASSAVEYSDVVSPLPDYSAMGATSIKKHLTKYGLKKSLSKNKAKKILRHIYEELHPIINTKNGKIVKYMRREDGRSTKKRGKVNRSAREKSKNKFSSVAERNESRNKKLKPEVPKITKKRKTSASCAVLESSKLKNLQDGDDADDSSTSCDTLDRTSEVNSEESEFDVEEPLSQTSFASAADAKTFVLDFIRSDPDIRHQILMYEPIWLEDFKKKLVEKYNKKFRLSDLMEVLDLECITFRCESYRKTRSRKKKVKGTVQKT